MNDENEMLKKREVEYALKQMVVELSKIVHDIVNQLERKEKVSIKFPDKIIVQMFNDLIKLSNDLETADVGDFSYSLSIKNFLTEAKKLIKNAEDSVNKQQQNEYKGQPMPSEWSDINSDLSTEVKCGKCGWIGDQSVTHKCKAFPIDELEKYIKDYLAEVICPNMEWGPPLTPWGEGYKACGENIIKKIQEIRNK